MDLEVEDEIFGGKCTNPSCQIAHHHVSDVQACTNSKCGIRRPRCPVCQSYFVANLYDLCTSCLLDDTATCDKCKRPSTKLFRTDLDELWCFSCLPKYASEGPALSFNKQIVEKSKEARSLFYNQQLPGITHICKSCKNKYNGPIDSNLCLTCLSLMNKGICTLCFNRVDIEIGTDKSGRCIRCSTHCEDLANGYNGSFGHKIFSDVDGWCTNCDNNRVMIGKQLCVKCVRDIKKINMHLIEDLDNDIRK